MRRGSTLTPERPARFGRVATARPRLRTAPTDPRRDAPASSDFVRIAQAVEDALRGGLPPSDVALLPAIDGMPVDTATATATKWLHVNAVVRAGGSLRVEVLDSEGNALAGYAGEHVVPITGDQLDATVAWTGGKQFADLSGRAVKLRITMRNADLYSSWVAP